MLTILCVEVVPSPNRHACTRLPRKDFPVSVIPFSRESFLTQDLCMGGRMFLPSEPPEKVPRCQTNGVQFIADVAVLIA